MVIESINIEGKTNNIPAAKPPQTPTAPEATPTEDLLSMLIRVENSDPDLTPAQQDWKDRRRAARKPD